MAVTPMEDWKTQTPGTTDAGFPRVRFASETAEGEWREAGSPAGLLETRPSSESGYTADDVREFLAGEE